MQGQFDHDWRRLLLKELKGIDILDADEFSLFEWYTRENGEVIRRMLAEEQAFVQKEIDAGNVDAGADNDGRLVIEYYIKRVRYADVIYLTSLLETYLDRACQRLSTILATKIIFKLIDLSGDKWTKRKKFLEGYGQFVFPEDYWKEIETLIWVRNVLVHDNGRTNSISGARKAELQKRTDIKDEQNELVIEDAYIAHCLSAAKSLAEFVRNQIDQAIDRSLRPQRLE